jgi:uncharacterized Zn finger protein
MPLATRLAFQFDKRVQIKGLNLFQGGAIRVTDKGDNYMFAEVKGGELYDVRLTYEAGKLFVWCDCPAFADNGPCKHLWGAVLEADRRGAVKEALNARYLEVQDEMDPGLEEDEDPATDYAALAGVPGYDPAGS